MLRATRASSDMRLWSQGGSKVRLTFTSEMPGTLATASTFASDPDHYMAALRVAWTKLMTADRFDGPTGNVCDAQLDDMTCTPANVGAACGSPTAGKSCTCDGRHARNLLFASTPKVHCHCA